MKDHNHSINGNFALITPREVWNNECSGNKYAEEYQKIIFQRVGILQCVYRSFQRHALML
jgi:hypothetical protein